MAALWKLPVVYVIENNKYGMGTSIARASAVTELYKRGESFGICGKKINGMDVTAVRNAAVEANKWCRDGNGPFILEMETYRYRGHSMSDPAKYRSKEEVAKIRKESDPIDTIRSMILNDKTITEESLKEIDKKTKVIVQSAVDFAQDSPLPDESELYTDVYQ